MLGLVVLFATAAALLIIGLTAAIVWTAGRPPRRTAAYAIARSLACDPGEKSWPFESWTLDRPDGARLPVWDIIPPRTVPSPDRSDDARATIVMIHGWGQSRINTLDRAHLYVPYARRLVLFDLRAHGDAEGGPSRLGATDHEDVVDLLQRIEDERIVLVGYSMGAAVAINTAVTGPDAVTNRICGVIALGAYDEFRTSLLGRLRAQRLPTRPFVDLAMVWFRRTGRRHEPLRDAAPSLPCPALFIHGADDPISPLSDAQRLAAKSRGELVVIDDAVHLDMEMQDPEACRAAVAAFVERIPGPAATTP